MTTPGKTWWRPVWVGLVDVAHAKRLKMAIFLLLYLIEYADPRTGQCHYTHTRARERTGFSVRTLQRWLAVLRSQSYITVESTGRGLRATIRNWRPIGRVKGGEPGTPRLARQRATSGAFGPR